MSEILELIESMKASGQIDAEFSLSPEELTYLQMLAEEVKNGDSGLLTQLFEDPYERPIVSPREWLEDPYYTGTSMKLYDKLKDDFCRIFEGEPLTGQKILEVIMTGSIGWGKTYLTAFCMMRIIYELSCLKSPQNFFGHPAAAPIVFMNLSVTAANAAGTFYNYCLSMADTSPYFKENFPRNPKINSALLFKKNIFLIPGSSSELSAIGLNIFGGAIDEANFMVAARKSARERLSEETDHARVLYNSLERRIRSRFKLAGGKFPGKLFLMSSKTYQDDFLEMHVRANQDSPEVLILDYAEWETKPRWAYSGDTFRVAVGNAKSSSKILVENEEVAEGTEVVEIPIEYMKPFRDDIDGALRDIAGRSSVTLHPFITRRSAIYAAIEHRLRDPRKNKQGIAEDVWFRLEHPFSKMTTTLRDGAVFEWPRIAEQKRIIEDNKYIYVWEPKYGKSTPRFCHFDLAISGDAAGMAIGYCTEMKEFPREVDGIKYTEVAPVIAIEMVLQIVAPLNGEIMLSDIRNLIYEYTKHGFFFHTITYDQFQSKDSQQILTSQGYTTERLSVDRDLTPYLELKNALYDNRLAYYEHPELIRELIKLQRDEKHNKIDHPEKDMGNLRSAKGSKDLSDAVAGVVHAITQYYAGHLPAPPPSKGYVEEEQRSQESPMTAKELVDWLINDRE